MDNIVLLLVVRSFLSNDALLAAILFWPPRLACKRTRQRYLLGRSVITPVRSTHSLKVTDAMEAIRGLFKHISEGDLHVVIRWKMSFGI